MDILQSTNQTVIVPCQFNAVWTAVFNDPGAAGLTVRVTAPDGSVSSPAVVPAVNTPVTGATTATGSTAAMVMPGTYTISLVDVGGAVIDVAHYTMVGTNVAGQATFIDSAGTATVLAAPLGGTIYRGVSVTAAVTGVLGSYAIVINDETTNHTIGYVSGNIVTVLGGGGLDAAGVRAALGMASANMDTQLGSVLTAIATRSAPGDAMTLTGGERTAISNALLDLASGIETGLTPRQLFRALGAALGGVVVQTAPGVWQFRGAGVATARITASIPGDGSRPSMVLSL
jgi:hypothetical protein